MTWKSPWYEPQAWKFGGSGSPGADRFYMLHASANGYALTRGVAMHLAHFGDVLAVRHHFLPHCFLSLCAGVHQFDRCTSGMTLLPCEQYSGRERVATMSAYFDPDSDPCCTTLCVFSSAQAEGCGTSATQTLCAGVQQRGCDGGVMDAGA